MNEKTPENSKTDQQTPSLTPREQEIFDLLIGGSSSKEISFALGITYDTVYYHQKNLYRKLDVNNTCELLIRYSPGSAPHETGANEGIAGVFGRWNIYQDTVGTHANVTQKVELIQEQYHTTHTFSGSLTANNQGWAGVTATPDPATLEVMKKMASFSFKVLGDGNTYEAMIATMDARTKGGDNHYRKSFATRKYEISTVTVNIDELAQSPLFGTPVPFVRDNILVFQIQAYSTGSFKLKIWDVRFHL